MEYNFRNGISMANVNIHKSRPLHFYASSNHFRDIVSSFLSSKSEGHGVQFSQWGYSVVNIKIYKKSFHVFLP